MHGVIHSPTAIANPIARPKKRHPSARFSSNKRLIFGNIATEKGILVSITHANITFWLPAYTPTSAALIIAPNSVRPIALYSDPANVVTNIGQLFLIIALLNAPSRVLLSNTP